MNLIQRREYHGLTRTPLWNKFQDMKERCYRPAHPQYANYGGRGIFICDRWLHAYSAFVSDMGEPPTPKHTIGRIDNDGPYSPENCRWETYEQQNKNRRTVELFTHDGETRCLKDWAAAIGMDYSTLHKRVRYSGWDIAKALTVPTALEKRRHPSASAPENPAQAPRQG
jgi:hypothetical protein